MSRAGVRRAMAGGLLAAMVLLAGCWDRVEVNDLENVSGVAFDTAPRGGYLVTASIVLPQNLPTPGGGGGVGGEAGPTAAVLSAAGPTVGEAIANLSQMLSGRIFWGQTRVILIGGPLARRGIDPVLDFFLRGRSPRLRTDLAVTPGDAGALLRLGPPLRVPATDVLFEHLRQGLDPRAFVYQVAESELTASDAILLPRVVGAAAPSSGAGNSQETSAQTASPQTFVFGGAGIFHHGRLVGWVDPVETMGALWVLGPRRPEMVRLRAPGGAELALRVNTSHLQRKAVRLPDGAVAVAIEVDVGASVEEVDAGSPPLDDPRYLQAVSDDLQRVIRRSVVQAWRVMRQRRVDFLQFGRLIAAYQPGVWRQLYARWPAELGRVPLVLQIHAEVRFTGNLRWLP